MGKVQSREGYHDAKFERFRSNSVQEYPAIKIFVSWELFKVTKFEQLTLIATQNTLKVFATDGQLKRLTQRFYTYMLFHAGEILY